MLSSKIAQSRQKVGQKVDNCLGTALFAVIMHAISFCLFSDEPTGRLALVFELMEMNLYEAIKGRTTYLPESRVKFYIY